MSKKDYTVGYGKPPEETRFQKGISGNPKGRPRKSKNTATIMREILYEEVTGTKNGELIQMSAKKAMFVKQANKALAGDIKAFNLFFPGIREVEPALAELEREKEAQRQEQYRLLRAMTAQEREQFLAIMRTARDRADEADAIKSKTWPIERLKR